MSKLKIGDRVVCVEKRGSVNIGDTGTILLKYVKEYGVHWDTLKRGHNLNGKLKEKYRYSGYFLHPHQLMLSDEVPDNVGLNYEIY